MCIQLKIHPLPTVDTQVLFRDYQPIDGQEIFDFIVRTAISMGVPANDCNLLKTSTDKDIRVLCGNYHCLVTQTVPLESGKHLEAALEAFSVKTSFPEAADVVRRSSACTQISVQKGLIPHDAVPQGLMDVAAKMTAFCDTEEARVAMALARAMTRFVVEKRKPDAVFWGPSLFLMKPEMFLELDQDETADLIYLHPHLHGEVDPDTGKQLVGVIGAGAPALIGYALEFRPCALPPDYLVRKMYEFLAFVQTSGRPIRDGEVFGKDETEKIQVLHHLPRNGGAPEIELKVVHNPDLGIVREEVPTIYRHYDADCRQVDQTVTGGEEADLDPNDPVDAAILEQLRALHNKTSGNTHAPGTAQPEPIQADAPVARPPEEDVPVMPEFSRRQDPPAPPPARRVSMDELRDFAQKAQTSGNDIEAQPPKRGLLGNLFGRKSD